MESKTVLDCHAEIEAAAKKADATVRNIRTFPVGKHVRQGDVYLCRVEDGAKFGKERGTRQVAVGTTVGSRHVAEGRLTVYESVGFQRFEPQFVGPVVVAEERWTLTHPEHAHVSLPAGCYQITHQTDARTMSRVQD